MPRAPPGSRPRWRQPRPPQQAGAAVPGWVSQIVLRGLSVEPAARFASMDELLAALARDPARRWRRFGKAAAIALVGVVVGFGVWRTVGVERCGSALARLGG